MKEREVVCELGAEKEEAISVATRSFYLKTKPGPLVMVKTGALLRLTPNTRMEAFWARKIEPVELGSTFRAKRVFNFVDSEGCWATASPGDVLKMNREEALDSLRRGEVVEIKGGANEG
jgi:uncharacterized protein